MQHSPIDFPVSLKSHFILPHTLISASLVTDLQLTNMLSLAAKSILFRYIYLLCVALSCDFVLLASVFLLFLTRMRFMPGL